MKNITFILISIFFTTFAFATLSLENKGLRLDISENGNITLKVKNGSNAVFKQANSAYKIQNILKTDNQITFDVLAKVPLKVSVKLISNTQFEMEVVGTGNFEGFIRFPAPWQTEKNDTIIYPLGNGYAFPVEKKLKFMPHVICAVHGWRWSMGLMGHQRGQHILISAFEKPYDIYIETTRKNGLNNVATLIAPEFGKFGYKRVFRFFTDNKLSRVMAQYRQWRKDLGYIKTLKEKSKELPHLSLLQGAADVWIWDENTIANLYNKPKNPNAPTRDIHKISAEMKRLGMTKILWNNFEGETPEDCLYLKKQGFLVGKYDIYRDVLPANIAHKIIPYRVKRSVNTKYWPQIVRVEKDGSLTKAWQVHGIDGKLYHQNAVCEISAFELTKKNVTADVEKVKYTARLIDVQAGSKLSECYSKEHPATRTISAEFIRKQNNYLAKIGLVRGVEVGHEIFASTYDFAEGMTSPACFRIDNAGRRMTDILTSSEMPNDTFEYVLNPQYRIPLWELVYHDCVVNFWYWGSSTNQCPSLMHKFDTFSSLYGYPPIYSIDIKNWNLLKNDIAKSYKRCVSIVKEIAFEQMIDFDYISTDKKIQKTTFANGKSVIANFSEKDFYLPDGTVIPAWSAKLK